MTLWAITSYFNSAGFKQRLRNFRVFRERLSVPLVAAELSYDGEFELESGDADILIQLKGGDVMWQKERLLNIALEALPDACDAVAWLDCDVVLERSDWAMQAEALLDEYVLVQPFRYAVDLARDELPEDAGENSHKPRGSLAYQYCSGTLSPEELRAWRIGPDRVLPCDGYAWVGRRDVLEKHRFYDARVLGGGARELVYAAFGAFGVLIGDRPFTPAQAEHLTRWAKPFFESVRGRVGHVDGRVFHLWHGDVADRRYNVRQHEFRKFGFDPYRDIAREDSGCWRWSSDKKDMHAYVKEYFESRREDG